MTRKKTSKTSIKRRKRDKNNITLRNIMSEYNLGRRDVGRLLHKIITVDGICSAVDKWLKKTSLTNYRKMRDADIRLLTLELQLIDEGHPLARDIQFEGPPDFHAITANARAARTYG